MATLHWLLLLLAPGALRADDDILTPAQRTLMKWAQTNAVGASLQAEGDLLTAFSEATFRAGLAAEGNIELLEMKGEEILQRLKANLESLEWTNNFGLDALSRKLHPGNEAMDLDTVDKYGRLPTDWELKVHNSTLTANVSDKQWAIFDAAETGIYKLPEFATPLKPTLQEALLRPKYLAGNLRRMDTGVQRYGAYGAVIRDSVARDRGYLIPGDSGGWESGGCNKTVVPVNKPDWIMRMMAKRIQCEPMTSTPYGVQGNQLHTVLANARMFGGLGAGLARVVHQFLTYGAAVRPLEENMYTEMALLGPIRMQDVKVLVGSFPGLFGTPEGTRLREFCQRHNLPLAWGLGGSRPWPDEESHQFRSYLMEWWPAGHERLLDPVAGWPSTNGTGPEGEAAWKELWQTVEKARNDHPGVDGIDKKNFDSWWTTLKQATVPVWPLRAGDCSSADLCFGTAVLSGPSNNKTCICRNEPKPQQPGALLTNMVV